MNRDEIEAANARVVAAGGFVQPLLAEAGKGLGFRSLHFYTMNLAVAVTKILTELGMRNKLRKIKIHVIGVGKAGELDLDFLKKLATQNKGSFVHRD